MIKFSIINEGYKGIVYYQFVYLEKEVLFVWDFGFNGRLNLIY